MFNLGIIVEPYFLNNDAAELAIHQRSPRGVYAQNATAAPTASVAFDDDHLALGNLVLKSGKTASHVSLRGPFMVLTGMQLNADLQPANQQNLLARSSLIRDQSESVQPPRGILQNNRTGAIIG